MKTINYYKMSGAETIQSALAALPVAEKVEITGKNGERIPNFRGIRVQYPNSNQVHYVACPSPYYALVQHTEAFQPVVEGLTLSGVKDFRYLVWSTPRKAQLQLFTAGEGYDSVSIGISIGNSVDSESSLKYGFELSKSDRYIELVGYRQVCSNGMKIRVPLDEAEIIREEERVEIESLLKQDYSFIHTKNMKMKIEVMQYITEALGLLREPVERLIKKAQQFKLEDTELVKELIKKHVGNRWKNRVEEQFWNESEDLWGLYNAVTYVASHDALLKDSARETLQSKAAELLLEAVA